MNKKHTIIIGLGLLILLITSTFVHDTIGEGYQVSIYNNTEKTLTDVNLVSTDGRLKYKLSNINSKKSVSYNINTNNIKNLHSLWLSYKDEKGNKQEDCIIKRLGAGYMGHVTVIVDYNDTTETFKLTID